MKIEELYPPIKCLSLSVRVFGGDVKVKKLRELLSKEDIGFLSVQERLISFPTSFGSIAVGIFVNLRPQVAQGVFSAVGMYLIFGTTFGLRPGLSCYSGLMAWLLQLGSFVQHLWSTGSCS